MHILHVLCIGRVMGMQVICNELISLYVRMFISSVNEHCGHYFIVMLIWLSHGLLLNSILLNRIVLASYALQVFLHTMIMLCCCVLGDTCSYDSRATLILELVSELCSTVPNLHVKSRVRFRFCHEIAKGGDCKVEFISHHVGIIPCQIFLYFIN